MEIALQMYTLRAITKKGFAAALKMAGEAGYRHVETYKPKPDEKNRRNLLAAAEEAGIFHISSQVEFGALEKDFEAHAAFLSETGCKNAVVAMPPVGVVYGGEAEWRSFCARMNILSGHCAARGIRLCYHHHQFEFVRLQGGVRPIDILIEGLDPSIGFVSDTFRAQQGGEQPAALIERLDRRLAGIHLRDYTVRRGAFGFSASDCPLGDGNLDIPTLLKTAKAAGADYAAVEQNSRRPFADAQKSFFYIQKIIS